MFVRTTIRRAATPEPGHRMARPTQSGTGSSDCCTWAIRWAISTGNGTDDGWSPPTCSARISSVATSCPAECIRSEEHTSELQSRGHLVCRLLLEKKKRQQYT